MSKKRERLKIRVSLFPKMAGYLEGDEGMGTTYEKLGGSRGMAIPGEGKKIKHPCE